MTVAKPEISWVLDITIAYPQGKPIDLPTIITGSRPPCETVLFYRLFPSSVVSFDIFFIYCDLHASFNRTLRFT